MKTVRLMLVLSLMFASAAGAGFADRSAHLPPDCPFHTPFGTDPRVGAVGRTAAHPRADREDAADLGGGAGRGAGLRRRRGGSSGSTTSDCGRC